MSSYYSDQNITLKYGQVVVHLLHQHGVLDLDLAWEDHPVNQKVNIKLDILILKLQLNVLEYDKNKSKYVTRL